MARIFCVLIVGIAFLWSSPVKAAEFNFDVSMICLDDGTFCGELKRNSQVLWRVIVFSDGARAVAGNVDANTTIVVPDIADGWFLLKMYNQ
ncbi:MAG: hypothetical protein H6Q73_2637 [Firmicutes bacterium]|nr:hypothetical protein [Bacillota bacterium]